MDGSPVTDPVLGDGDQPMAESEQQGQQAEQQSSEQEGSGSFASVMTSTMHALRSGHTHPYAV